MHTRDIETETDIIFFICVKCKELTSNIPQLIVIKLRLKKVNQIPLNNDCSDILWYIHMYMSMFYNRDAFKRQDFDFHI
jgi:hypothetical protein